MTTEEPAVPEPPVRPDVQLVAFEPRRVRQTTLMVLALIVGLFVLQWMLGAVGHFLFILLLAFLWAIAMEPIVRRLADRGWRRGLGTGLVMVSLFLLGAIFSVVFGGLFAQQVSSLINNLPAAVTSTIEFLNSHFHTTINPNDITTSLNITPGKLAEYAGSFAGGLLGLLGTVVGGLFDAVTVVVFAFYLSADGPRLRRTIGSWLPSGPQKVFVTVYDIAVDKTGGFVISKVALAFLSATAHSVAFLIIGVPYWLPMGILAGVTSQFIPTIGTYIGIIIPAMFFLANQQYTAIIWVIIFATVYQQIENYLLMPRISRWTMNMHPAVALASVFVGVAFFGPIGALIGMPIAAAVLAVIETYGRRYELIPELSEPASATPAAPELVHPTQDVDAMLAEAWQREHELDALKAAQTTAERETERATRESEKAARLAERAAHHDAD